MTECSYCSKQTDELWGTPYMADIGIGAKMCRTCWEWTDEASGGEIGSFPKEVARG